MKDTVKLFTVKKVVAILLGTAIMSFGMYNIHSRTGITEGGVFGLILLINHWFGVPASIVSPILDIICYTLGFKYLGKDFLKVSALATISFAAFCRFWEQFPPMLPDLSAYPLVAALLGGMFIGLGCGMVVCNGASSGGDDAIAMVIAKLTGGRVAFAYVATDLSVLLLSLSYIPVSRIAYSIVTVTCSSFLIDIVQRLVERKRSSASGEIA